MPQIIKDLEELQQALSALCWLVQHLVTALRWIRDRWAHRKHARERAGLDDDKQSVARGAAPLMEYPFPLRDTLDVSLVLPRDLTEEEADRLSIFISSLARYDAISTASVEQPTRS